jgi:hypothetical protein
LSKSSSFAAVGLFDAIGPKVDEFLEMLAAGYFCPLFYKKALRLYVFLMSCLAILPFCKNPFLFFPKSC